MLPLASIQGMPYAVRRSAESRGRPVICGLRWKPEHAAPPSNALISSLSVDNRLEGRA